MLDGSYTDRGLKESMFVIVGLEDGCGCAGVISTFDCCLPYLSSTPSRR